VTYRYDAWGNLENYSDYSGVNLATKNPYRYRSYRYDNETGYYYLQSRYYDPSIGRFISADNVGYLGAGENLTSYNLYAYCNNNPVMYSDPTGQFVFTTAIIVGLIVGAIVGGTLGGVTAYKSAEAAGKTGSELFWETAAGVGTGAVLGSAVGFVATAGTPFLIGGLMSTGGKMVADLTAYASFGKPMGTWESYAVAFVFGGLTKGFGIGGAAKFGLDVLFRPGVSQLVEMGTRGNSWNTEKFMYDVFCRAGTYGMPGDLKPISRGLLSGLYYWLTQGNSSLGYYYA
jgi:RHS repeat-associated protein